MICAFCHKETTREEHIDDHSIPICDNCARTDTVKISDEALLLSKCNELLAELRREEIQLRAMLYVLCDARTVVKTIMAKAVNNSYAPSPLRGEGKAYGSEPTAHRGEGGKC
jgi:hypothetical protein